MGKAEPNPLEFRLIFLAGNHASMRKKRLDEILVAAELADADAFDRESIISSEKPFAEWVSAASTTPFLAQRRAVIVRNIFRVTPEQASESLSLKELENLPPSALLIFVADEETKTDDSRNVKSDPAAAWKKVVKASGGLIIQSDLPDKKNVRSVQSVVQDSGKKINAQAMNQLLEMVAFRGDRAEEELEKLILYVGDHHEITVHDVRACVTPEPEHNIFQLCDSIWAGDAARALQELSRLQGQTRDFRKEAMGLISFMIGQVRMIWQAKSSIEDSGTRYELTEKPLSKMHSYPQGKARDTARKLSYEQLNQFNLIIRKANGHLTAGSQGDTPEETIEQMILELCQVARRGRSA